MKNFDDWNKIKKKVEDRNRTVVKSGSICICNFGLNIGYETDGKNNIIFGQLLFCSDLD